jgi:hypothetical protein
MSIEGRINIDCLFHDKDGTASLKVVSLQDSKAYTTGKVAVITGTAGTAQVSFASIGTTSYKNAAGDAVSFSAVQRVAFSWGGTSERTLAEIADSVFFLRSKSGSVALSDCTAMPVQPQISSGTGTGTYTILLYGT